MLRFASIVVGTILAAVLGDTPAGAQTTQSPEHLSGCYDLTLGEWEPALHPGNVTRQTPPGVFLLSLERKDRGSRAVYPLIPHGMRPTASWRPVGDDSVRIWWSNGFSGARLEMRASGDGLSGTAAAVTDVIGPPVPTTEAVARAVPCPEWLLELPESPDRYRAQAVSRELGTPISWQVVYEPEDPAVSGTVVGPSGAGLQGAIVSIREAGMVAISDSTGHFRVAAPPPGEWQLVAQARGHEGLEERIVLPHQAGLRLGIVFAAPQTICSNACLGTGCTDLGLQVVDAVTGERPGVPVRIVVRQGDDVREAVHAYDPGNRIRHPWFGLGEPVETVGWHSIEVHAEGYESGRLERVWLEIVQHCHGHLLGREHRVELVPSG